MYFCLRVSLRVFVYMCCVLELASTYFFCRSSLDCFIFSLFLLHFVTILFQSYYIFLVYGYYCRLYPSYDYFNFFCCLYCLSVLVSLLSWPDFSHYLLLWLLFAILNISTNSSICIISTSVIVMFIPHNWYSISLI